MAAAGALAWARRLALPLPGALNLLQGQLGVPDSDFCVNATYEHRLDDPSTYNFCRWGSLTEAPLLVECHRGDRAGLFEFSLLQPCKASGACTSNGPICPRPRARSVPGGGPEAFLFGALAVLVACCLHFSSLSAVFVLVAGALVEGLVFPFNLGR